MKEELKITNRKQKLQILTLIPNSWSVRKATEEFQVSESTIQKAKILRAEKGIIGYADTTKQQRLSQELLGTVTNIYCDDEFSRQVSGKKDDVSVSKNVLVSKGLLLCKFFSHINPNTQTTSWIFEVYQSKTKMLYQCWSKRYSFCLCMHNSPES